MNGKQKRVKKTTLRIKLIIIKNIHIQFPPFASLKEKKTQKKITRKENYSSLR